MAMRRIIVTGGMRTGSTLIFNLCQEICLAAGRPVRGVGASEDDARGLLALNGIFLEKDWVVKCHWFDPYVMPLPEGAVLLNSSRSGDEVMRSLARLGFPCRETMGILEKNRAHDQAFAYAFREGMKSFSHERLLADLAEVTRDLAQFLFPEVFPDKDGRALEVLGETLSERWALDRVRRYCAGLSEADAETQFRPQHVGPEGEASPLPEDYARVFPPQWEENERAYAARRPACLL